MPNPTPKQDAPPLGIRGSRHGLDAPVTERRMLGHVAHGVTIIPTALTLFSFGLHDVNGSFLTLHRDLNPPVSIPPLVSDEIV